MKTADQQLHASCVAILGRAVLLLGESGAGKSSLALRLIDAGAILVADDQVLLTREESAVFASPPETIAGALECRGVGIISLPFLPHAPVELVIKLVPKEQVERLPEDAFFDCLGMQLRLLLLDANDPTTDAKIRYVLTQGR